MIYRRVRFIIIKVWLNDRFYIYTYYLFSSEASQDLRRSFYTWFANVLLKKNKVPQTTAIITIEGMYLLMAIINSPPLDILNISPHLKKAEAESV